MFNTIYTITWQLTINTFVILLKLINILENQKKSLNNSLLGILQTATYNKITSVRDETSTECYQCNCQIKSTE